MDDIVAEPDYYSISSLSKKLNISPTRIETDIKTGKIIKYKLENQNIKARLSATKRIMRLIHLFNEYARNNLDNSPDDIILYSSSCVYKLSTSQQAELNDNKASNDIFIKWINAYGYDISQFKIVIPISEVDKYVEHLTSSDGDLVDKIANEISRKENELLDDAKKLVAFMRDKNKANYEIAHALKEKYGRRITGHVYMRLIDEARVIKWESLASPQGRPRSWFENLLKKYNKNKKSAK